MKKLLIVGGAMLLPMNLFGLSMELDCTFICDVRTNGYTARCQQVCNSCFGSTKSDAVNGVITVRTKELVHICPSVDGGIADCSCNTTTSYKCAAGYYGTPSPTNQTCTQCPEASDIYTNSARTVRARGTSKDGATSKNDCYLPAGTYYDATGQFVIDTNQTCYF